MNNDFNFRPSQQPKPQSTPADQAAASEVPEAPEQTVPAKVITSGKGGGGFKGLLAFLGILLLAAAAAGGVYYWQQSKVKDLQTAQVNLQNQVALLKANKTVGGKDDSKSIGNSSNTNATGQTSASTNAPPDITSGDVISRTNTTAKVNADYLPGKVTEIWVEYDLNPTSLNKSTKHVKVTSEGGNANVEVPFDLTELGAGTQYFYRAAGLVDGKTVYGGVVAFKTAK